MRRRRLYRYARNRPPVQRGTEPGYASPSNPANADDHQAFISGVSEGMRLATMQQDRIIAEAHRSALAAARQHPFMLMARRSGYDEGYAAGMQVAVTRQSTTPEPPRDAEFTYVDVEAARQRGFEEGRISTSTGAANEGQIRGKAIDDMLEQCRVISESNPSMSPGVNAVRHMIKKLAR
jgi:hypothetical protein